MSAALEVAEGDGRRLHRGRDAIAARARRRPSAPDATDRTADRSSGERRRRRPACRARARRPRRPCRHRSRPFPAGCLAATVSALPVARRTTSASGDSPARARLVDVGRVDRERQADQAEQARSREADARRLTPSDCSRSATTDQRVGLRRQRRQVVGVVEESGRERHRLRTVLVATRRSDLFGAAVRDPDRASRGAESSSAERRDALQPASDLCTDGVAVEIPAGVLAKVPDAVLLIPTTRQVAPHARAWSASRRRGEEPRQRAGPRTRPRDRRTTTAVRGSRGRSRRRRIRSERSWPARPRRSRCRRCRARGSWSTFALSSAMSAHVARPE